MSNSAKKLLGCIGFELIWAFLCFILPELLYITLYVVGLLAAVMIIEVLLMLVTGDFDT